MTPMLTANDSTAPTITPEDSGANSERWGFRSRFRCQWNRRTTGR